MFIQNRVHVFIAGRKIKYVQTWTFSKQFFSSTVNPIRAFQNTDTGSRDMAVLQKLMGAWRHKRVLRTRQFNTRNRLNAHGYMARYRKYHFSSRRWSVFREKKSIENYTFPNYTFPPGRPLSAGSAPSAYIVCDVVFDVKTPTSSRDVPDVHVRRNFSRLQLHRRLVSTAVVIIFKKNRPTGRNAFLVHKGLFIRPRTDVYLFISLTRSSEAAHVRRFL